MLGWLGVPRTSGNATGGGPEARVPRATLPEAGQRPAHPGKHDRMRASGPCSLGQRDRCGPAARAPREPLPDAGQRPVHPGETDASQRPAHLGQRDRMRASGPCTLGNTTGGGPEARVPWATLPEAGRRPAYPGEYYRRRAGGPRTLVDDLSGVMLNVPLAVVIPPPPPSSPI